MNPSQEPPQPPQPSFPPADGAPYGPTHPDSPGPEGQGSGWSGSGPEGYGSADYGPEGYQPEDGGLRGRLFRRSSRRSWRRTLVVSVVTALIVFALGGPLGLLWAWIAPNVPVIDAGQAGIVVNDPSPEEYIAADGWFTLLGFGFGLLAAIVAWLVVRRDRGPFLLFGVIAGTLGAGYLLAPWVGELIGRGDYQHWRETAVQGATYFAPPQVHSLGPKLVPAFVAAVVLTLLAGWSNDPDLDSPGAKPGYGPNNTDQDPYDEAPTPSWPEPTPDQR